MKVIILFFLMSFFSCNSYDRAEIRKMLDSEDKNKLMEAVYLIGENRDSFFIDDLIRLSYDPRVVHKMEYLGMSIHYGCIGALKKLTNQLPPNKIDYEVDSVNISFYKNLLKK